MTILKNFGLWLAKFKIVPMSYGLLKALISGKKLPPGPFISISQFEKADRPNLLKHSKRVGPIFKSIDGRRFCVCIVGIPLCRRFLQEHSSRVTPLTIKVESLFPKGFIRQMKDDVHRNYRKSLMRAINSNFTKSDIEQIERIVATELKAYAEPQIENGNSADEYIKALNTITSRVLIYLFFGGALETEYGDTLLKLYRKLGPDGFEWFIGEKEREAFFEIRNYLLEIVNRHKRESSEPFKSSILDRLSEENQLDETMLGNLIYMVEMGRFDMHSLFRWVSKYAGESPSIIADIAREEQTAKNGQTSLSEAFVLETLRLNQSERLMRAVDEDIIFDGYLIPKYATVRLCLWESHKLEESFENPFEFNPDRFLEGNVKKDQYSPFGIGEHSCPFADISIKMSAAFIRVLARNYQVEPVLDGPTIRGRYHWQPAKLFSVKLIER